MKEELFYYLRDFVQKLKQDIKIEDINLESTFNQLSLDSMDFVELHVSMMEDFQVDIFKNQHEDLKNMSIDSFISYILKIGNMK
ncbi:acyl carrier protein [Xenorhabdus japonica]|uniref:Acyl carrier protein n=1 Tax=Xenorhabdus japonica TaxID=53341 RepID=A0A1I4YCQ6_9GAMM|nr:acyl carrier protein [Xenorhabdus japonica]SFN35756.1 acyl carrier protein [Xenorhabdus japonica]